MQPFVINRAEFVTSVAPGGHYPSVEGEEIAIVGKSNVGKSSLINRLTNNRKLAKTSSTPGKTRMINFFRMNGSFYLVDLPGYGFAKAPKNEQAAWGQLIESYLSSGRVKHLFMLVDIRHEPTLDDRQMFKYVVYYGIPFTLIATKADKIAKSKRKAEALKCAKSLGAPAHAIAWSSETGDGMPELLERIAQILGIGQEKENDQTEEIPEQQHGE